MHRLRRLAPAVAALLSVFALAATATADQHLYLADATDGRVLGYNVTLLGSASELPGSPFAAGAGTSAVAVSPDGSTLWAANGGDDTISTFSVSASGVLAPAGEAIPSGGSDPVALAVAPDGDHLYVVNQASPATIAVFDVGASGALVAHSDPLAIGGSSPRGVAVSPDGLNAYVAVSESGTIQSYSIGASGGLTPLGDPVPVGGRPYWISIQSDGSTAYATDNLSGGIRLLTRAPASGVLTSVPQLVSAGDHPQGSAISANGYVFAAATLGGEIWRMPLVTVGPSQSAKVASFTAGSSLAASAGAFLFGAGGHSLQGWRVGLDGSLTSLGAAIDTGPTSSHLAGALVFAPDRPPRASFSSAASVPGTYSTFDATGSTDADGSLVHYSWDFGDGEFAPDGGVVAQHAYLNPGTYTVRVTLTDDAGCSTAQVFTGQTMSCVAAPAATTTRTVTIENAPQPPIVNHDIPCLHDGDDGFCGTPDHKAPQATLLVIKDGLNYSTDGAPTQIVGTVSPDPSGIQKVDVLFTRQISAAKTVKVKVLIKKKKATKRQKKKRATSARKKKKRYRIVKKLIPAKCSVLTASGFGDDVNCRSGKFFTFAKDTPFVYEIPGFLPAGSYTLQVRATDGAGNVDTLEPGRNVLTFKVSKNGTGSVDNTVTTT